ncbi:hypothetical protein B0T19DRAFT_274588 [Cercophora scortea]|uniref:Uncharacterized protein n=1 Tax=Cercophora scortea TaxID=314031 RepID=A0AAE0I859_9PEZI|nr:hypothetical protein B0T19DRAFT_274588 [Cercophora scortea]
MSTRQSYEDILKTVNHHHEEYVKHLRLLHEATAKTAIAGSVPHGPVATGTSVNTPTDHAGSGDSTRAITFSPEVSPAQNVGSQTWTPTNGSQDPRRVGTFSEKKLQPSSLYGNETDSEDGHERVNGQKGFLPLTSGSPSISESRSISETAADTHKSYVQNPLEQEAFSNSDLAVYLSSLDETTTLPATAKAFDTIWQLRPEIGTAECLNSFRPPEDGPYGNATYEVYEVDKHSIPKPKHTDNGDREGALDASTVWETIKDVNSSGDAVGRITILQEPTPLMLGAAHLTMRKHFDMDELLYHLVDPAGGSKGKTEAYMDRAFESEPLKQRSFFFVFKYYTVVGEGLTPAPWQAFDSRPQDRRSDDHIDLAECSSILALSLGGEPTNKKIRPKTRKKRAGAQTGALYGINAPWHLLSIQRFPDDIHTMRSEDTLKPLYNGPYAFLDSLGVEYRDAVKRYTLLNDMITRLITPPQRFMFDTKLRDKLLFEDQYFTYSRRYFWAFNTLGVINHGIKSMRCAYIDTFTKDFWAGRHHTLWPHPNPNSAEGREYLERMDVLRLELESVIEDLQKVYDKNDRTRNEIRSLREQLFSGSSVKESRRAIEQGDNIKILTSVSMIFLPLTFVTVSR